MRGRVRPGVSTCQLADRRVCRHEALARRLGHQFFSNSSCVSHVSSLTGEQRENGGARRVIVGDNTGVGLAEVVRISLLEVGS